MKVAVAYAEAKQQMVLDIEVSEGISAEQAIHKSGILGKLPDIDLTKNKTGVFGKIVPLEHILSEGDRVEIYRPAMGKPPKKSGAARVKKASSTPKPDKAVAKTEATATTNAQEKVETGESQPTPEKKVADFNGEQLAAKADAASTATGDFPNGATTETDSDAEEAAKMATAKARVVEAKAKMKKNETNEVVEKTVQNVSSFSG